VTSAVFPSLGERREALRWPACALAVLALHALGLVALVTWRARLVPAEPASVITMVELEPVQAPAPPVAAIERPPEPPDVPIILPQAAPVEAPEIALPPPPKPKPMERKSPPQRIEKRSDPPPPNAVEQPTASPVPSPAVGAAPAASVAAPPSPDAVADFQRLLLAQLNRVKRYPVLAQRRRAQGVAYLRFTMDRSGKVLAAQLERSSGHGDLDEEVLALIKRADPLPPFPPELAQAQLELVVPVQFSLR